MKNTVSLNAKCSVCKGPLVVTVESAAHDKESLDIQVYCTGKCKKMWNSFVKLSDMALVE